MNYTIIQYDIVGRVLQRALYIYRKRERNDFRNGLGEKGKIDVARDRRWYNNG